ncbi:excisionase [Pleomorphomonas carboxyditropha]|uniref:Uncharacterized protein n=1 Tax=Pleomorphomonas carboxyditropha TaxID=2023338 RepID=A0A2G9WY92_9HYPH|nr:excisionase [Pleomorphomonas carboxyditropha]PIO99653.1 hypothetical protein CJ014_10135 [Pleomorphomonas carboxyditropha]
MATNPPAISDDTPLRLADAVEIAFPMGGMTVSGLRSERDAGRLVVRRIAGKDFTTLADIRSMMDKCRVQPKAPGSTSEQGKALPRSGTSKTGKNSPALAALLTTIQEQKESLRATSAKKTR